MNEELKPGALSSGLAPGKEQNAHPRHSAASELNDFLVRRQLLAMESQRIQSVLVEIENENKGRQSQLVDFRNRVLASIREHRALRELALREERARRESRERKQTLRDLAKTAERYLRRKGKQLVSNPKFRPAAVTETLSEVPAADPGWYLPKAGQLNAWLNWFAENKSSLKEGALSKRSDPGRLCCQRRAGRPSQVNPPSGPYLGSFLVRPHDHRRAARCG